jgi:putative hydrolase of the HAD superfamily
MGCLPLRIVIFDLDDTLYPRSSGMMLEVGRRILRYMTEQLGMEPGTARLLRQAYLQDYGTTMAGLLRHNHLDPDDYLEYVHDLPVGEYLSSNPDLDLVLQAIPLEKTVWTNGSQAHAYRVLDALGIRDHFVRVIDVVDTGYVSKPAAHIYPHVLDMLGARGPECILVEDSVRNLRPAKDLGVSTILVGEGAKEAVDVRISRIEQIGGAVSRLQERCSADHSESPSALAAQPAGLDAGRHIT